ncbi:MAG: phosphonate C-P lyase system protein PhnH [Pseudomonadota bacterium]
MTTEFAIADTSAPTDGVRLSQARFRVLLQTLARPCQPQDLPGCATTWDSFQAIASVLIDHETSVVCLPDDPELAEWLAFRCDAVPTRLLEDADFVLAASPEAALPLSRFKLGSEAFPDRSATLVVGVDGMIPDGALMFGPGLEAPTRFGVTGQGADALLTERRALEDLFPRGLDIFFLAGGKVAGLPRSTRTRGA